MSKNLLRSFFFLLMGLMAAHAVFKAVAVTDLSLEKLGNWSSEKTKLKLWVMAAYTTPRSPQPLLAGRLNLDRWFGFQRFVLKNKMTPHTIKADIILEQGAYLYFFYQIDDDFYEGIRLSNEKTLPSLQFRMNHEGKFLATKNLTVQLPPETKYQASFSYSWDDRILTIKKDIYSTSLKIIPFENTPPPYRIGFQGGLKPVSIDDLDLVADDFKYFESFENENRFRSARAFTFTGLLLISIFIFFLLQKKQIRQQFFMWAVMISLLLTIISSAWYNYSLYIVPSKYPHVSSLKLPDEFKSPMDIVKAQIEHIRELDDRPLILFFGTSQTWGSGASEKEKRFVDRFARLVGNEYNVADFSIMGFGIKDLNKVYEEANLHKEKIRYFIVNLGTNDSTSDPADFKKNLEYLYQLHQDQKVKFIFVLEPNSFDQGFGENHKQIFKVIKDFAEKNNSPVLDMFNYIQDNRNSGILWWDFVHLSDYGQELFARRLYSFFLKNK